MLRYCVLSIPRSGSTWLTSGIFHILRSLRGIVNLCEYNVLMHDNHIYELDDKNYVLQQYTKKFTAEEIKNVEGTMNVQEFIDNRINLLANSNINQPLILKYLVWHGFCSVKYNDYDNIKKLQDANFVVLNLDRNPFDCAISREVVEHTGIVHCWKNSTNMKYWHTTEGNKYQVDAKPRCVIDTEEFKVNYAEYLMTYNLKQQIASDLKCLTISYDNLREDCLINKVPFHYHSHSAKLYDEDYSDIILNYDDLVKIKHDVDTKYGSKTI
jgi:hypothetical protein